MKTKTSHLNPTLQKIVDLIEDKRGKSISILDVEESPIATDYFVITSADNSRKLRAIAKHIKEKMGEEPFALEGLDSSSWIVLDYGDVIVHVFDDEAREFYDLEGLWGDVIWESEDDD